MQRPFADDLGRVRSIQIGAVAPLGTEGVPSGFVKRAVRGAVEIGLRNIVGDAQADLRVHGGPEKAVYAYPWSHYAAWARDFPTHAARLVAGGFGENFTVDGATESDVCVGDVHEIGTARLQACQPRQPCFKLALRFDDSRMPGAMMQNGRVGWYYRVLEPGRAEAGDRLRLVDRPNPDFPFERLVALISGRGADVADIERMASMVGLARHLRVLAARALGRSRPRQL